MEKEKKPTSAGYAKLVKFFTSPILRNFIFGLVLVLSLFAMFVIDKANYIRNDYLPFLNAEWINEVFAFLKIERYDLPLAAWLIFLTIFAVGGIFLIFGMFQSRFVNARVRKKGDAFRNEAHARRHYAFIYNLCVFVLCAALVFIAYMLGAYDQFADAAQQTNVILNLVYCILMCLIFALLIPAVVFIVYGVFRLIMYIGSYFVYLLTNFKKDVSASKKLDEARRQGKKATEEKTLSAKDSLFPSLVRLDEKYPENEKVENVDQITLEEFAYRFQSYAISQKIYYGMSLIRSFVAGLASSRLIVLEGLSGTGKSMLPRMFSEFTGTKSFFAPVQATWRDKTDLLGYYSEFTKTFKSTDFLQNLYEASYLDRMNIMVLDEMNISRIEYYFADFLSILEYPPEDWNIRVFEPDIGQELPAKLTNGFVKIPENTWFVGTANTDDSTFTITDKVYDRAIVLDFSEKFSPITSDYCSDPVKIDAETLTNLFKEAQANEELCLNEEDKEKFTKICDFTRHAFDIRFGNRIMVQIENFVPVYVALGGTKEEALDFMFARKILRKLNGMFEDYVKDELIALTKLLNETYGQGVFVATEKTIAKIMKKLV